MRILANGFILGAFSLSVLASCAHASVVTADSGIFSGRYKVMCENGTQGCACIEGQTPDSAAVTRLTHNTPVSAVSPANEPATESMTRLQLTPEQSCWYPTRDLRPIYWQNSKCPDPELEKSLPFQPIGELLSEGSIEGEQRSIGPIFPTFYNIADESFHEGEPVESLKENGTGKEIAKVSKSFRDDLDMQGTGRLRDGRVLNVAEWINKVWNYRVLPEGDFGNGIQGHRIRPLRSVALDFAYLCKATGQDFCNQSINEVRRRMVGSLLYVPRLKGAILPNGAIHDGYLCAQDIGGAIKADRMDMFVGPSGTGNPYLPECRQRNPYTDNGIRSVDPTDWPTVVRDGTDSLGRTTYKRVDAFEYRTASPGKGLEVFWVKGARCKP